MDLELLNEFLTEAMDLLDSTEELLVRLEKSPADAGLLNGVFRGYHTIKGGAGFLELEGLIKICHRLESLFDALRSGKLPMSERLMDLALLASNSIRAALSSYAHNPAAAFEPEAVLLADLDRLLAGDSGTSGSAGASAAVAPTDLLTAKALVPMENTTPAAPTREGPAFERETHIKVDTRRLDAVLTLASEVGLAKNRLGAVKIKIMAKDCGDETLSDLDRSFNDLERLTSSLQNAVMLTRMQPIGRIFAKYPRLVRDLARTLGKKMEIHMDGEDTEIDKGMIEDLADPLIHLIRNAADHGIELPEARLSAGKSETGSIHLAAAQEGDRIVIRVSDDGKGLDPARIRAKAYERGLLAPGSDTLSDKQVLELIFQPGFSTAETLSDVSGRGVGMDVVKTNIAKLGGEIALDSEPGRGTTVEIRIPLTLAVLPALLLTAGGQPLAVPLASVQEIITLSEANVQLVGGKTVINLRGEILQALDLSEILGWGRSDNAPVAAVVDVGGRRKAALLAEGFIGRDEVMVKSLEGAKPSGVSGVVVDSRGEIVLILDLKELLEPHFGKFRTSEDV